MHVLRAFGQALRLVITSPRLVILLWITLLLAAAPFGLFMQAEIARDIGASRVHEDLRERMDMLWLGEFRDRQGAFGRSLQVVRMSRADFLDNLDLLFSGRLFEQHRGLLAGGLAYSLVWLLLLGGLIDRFARGGGRLVLSQFLGACGRYFPRLFVLTAGSAVGYWGIYALARSGYAAIEAATADVTVEAKILQYYLLAAVPVLMITAVVAAVADYARVAAVVEERGIGSALRRGARFVGRRPLKVFGLTLLVTLLALAIVVLRTLFGPEPGESTALGVLGVFLFGQLFLTARLVLRATRVGAEVVLYRKHR